MVVYLGFTNAFLELFRGDSVWMPFGVRLPMILGFLIAVSALIAFFLIREKPFLERVEAKSS